MILEKTAGCLVDPENPKYLEMSLVDPENPEFFMILCHTLPSWHPDPPMNIWDLSRSASVKLPSTVF